MKRFFLAFLCAAAFLGMAAYADTGEWFFKNNINNDTRLIEMKMLGAHDAFTASLNANSPADEAGVKLGDSGSKWAATDLWKMVGLVDTSKAQSAHVDELLNSGVRYFDVRLSRYQNGGEFYTTHGRISDQFTGEGGIARKIAQWAAAHPGEIIVLDFQSLFDIQTDNGGATTQSWKDLMTKLTQDGITSYVYTKDGSIIDYTYGGLTNNATRAAIVLFGQVTGTWADGRFINRRDSDGYVRSLWTDTTSYDKMYSKLSEEIVNIRSNTETYYYKFRIMQAQTTQSPLIGKADENNIKMLTDESFDNWIQVLPVLMVDNATTDAGNFNALAVEKLAKANRSGVGGKYWASSGKVTLYGSNDNVPLGARFVADLSKTALSLTLDSGETTGEMTVSFVPSLKVCRVYDENGNFVAETGADGRVEFKTALPATYRLEETEQDAPFAVTKPMLRYSFTDESGLSDISGNGYHATTVGSPSIGGGSAKLSPGNVIKLPAGLTRNMKDYTVSSWVYVKSPVKGSRLFDIGRNARGSVFARVSSDNTSAGYKNTETKQALGNAPAVGKWMHITNTYSSASKMLSLYIDGKFIKSESAAANPAPDSINDYLNPNGSYIGRTQWYFIDENRNENPDINADAADFRIYDSVLSANEIARLARTVTVNIVDERGNSLKPSVTVPVGQAYNGYTSYGEIEGYSLDKIEGVDDVAVSNEIFVRYRSDKLSVSVTKGDAAAVVSLSGPLEGLDGITLIGAVYSGEGVLERAVMVDAGLGRLELPCEDGCIVKGFLWDMKNLVPKL